MTKQEANRIWKEVAQPFLDNPYIPHMPSAKQMVFCRLTCRRAFYGGAAGGGKILADTGLVLTPFGWKKGSELKVGSLINNPDGSVQRIIQIKPRVTLDQWTVHFSDRTYTDVAADHLWLAWKARKSRKIKNKRTFGLESAEVVETRELQEWIDRGYNPQIPVCEPQPFNWPSKEIDKLDPYLLGVLLGDGHLCKANIEICCAESDKDHYRNVFGIDGISYKSPVTVRFVGEKNKYIISKLRLYDLYKTKSYNKFIPDTFKYSTIDNRWELVRGLMDTDGYSPNNKNGCYFESVSKDLAYDLAFVLRSLGCVVTITKGEGSYKNENGEKVICQDVYHLYIKTTDPDNLFKLERKKHGRSFGRDEISKSIDRIETAGKITGRCITVSNPNGLYITDDFIVTHNSDAILMDPLQFVHVPGYNAIIFRKTYTDLSQPEGLIDRAKHWLANVHWNDTLKTFTFPSGAKLAFGYLNGPDDHRHYQGGAYQYIGFDEASQLRWAQMKYLMSRLRRLKGSTVPLKFRLASNPGGLSHVQLKKDYVQPYLDAKRLEYLLTLNELTDEEQREYYSLLEIVKPRKDRLYIPARIADNPGLDQETYIENLMALDPVTREQLLNGDWSIQEGGRIFSSTMFEVVDTIPDNMKLIRYWDLAATEKLREGQDPDYTSGCLMARDDRNTFYVLHINRFRCNPGETEDRIRQQADIDGTGVEVFMEQEPGASGKSLINHYQRNVLTPYSFKGIPSTGSKIDRAKPVAAKADAGMIKILRGTWNQDYFNELEVFPDGEHDDQVDSTSGAFMQLAQLKGPRAIAKILSNRSKYRKVHYSDKAHYGSGAFK